MNIFYFIFGTVFGAFLMALFYSYILGDSLKAAADALATVNETTNRLIEEKRKDRVIKIAASRN